MEYRIANHSWDGGLKDEVNRLLKEGWRCQVGVSAVFDVENNCMRWSQAMVRG